MAVIGGYQHGRVLVDRDTRWPRLKANESSWRRRAAADFGNQESRARPPVENVVIGFDRIQARPDFRSELARLGGQDHIHGGSAPGGVMGLVLAVRDQR